MKNENEKIIPFTRGGVIMGGKCSPSGGTTSGGGRSSPMSGAPNSRFNLLDALGRLIQSRWFGPRGEPLLDRDYRPHHGHPSPHDHHWVDGERQGWVDPVGSC